VIRRDALAALDLLDQYRQGRDRWSEAAPKLAEETAAIETRIDLPYIQKNLGRMLESTAKGLERVRDIVRNLRDFARLDEAEFKDIDINAALETTVEILRHELKQHGIELAMELEPLPPFLGHPSKINQVFLNLLMNAIQACPPAGRITVRTFARDGHLGIEVEDNGSGISPEHLPHIFEPFFTTKPVGQGTGLGLSVSYGIVRDHGGRIEAESEPGTRTRFRVWLPERTEEPS
jgi:signal transduction histidine kinase